MNESIRSGPSAVARNSELNCRLHDRFDDSLLGAFISLSEIRNRSDPWIGRWDGGLAYARWKFAGLDGVPALLAGAWVGSRLLGTIGLRPMTARFSGHSRLAGELGDLYVDPALRGQGVFSRLVHLIAEGARQRGYEFVFCVPNKGGFGALLSTGAFHVAKRAERLVCVLPLVPSAFLSGRLSAVGRVGMDPIMRQLVGASGGPVLEWTPLSEVPALAEVGEAKDAGLSIDFSLEQRIHRHPDATRYLLTLGADVGGPDAWTIAKRGDHHGRTFLLLGAVRGPSSAGRRRLLRAVVRDAKRQGYHAVALWAHRRRLGDVIGVGTQFLPVARKRFAILKTSLANDLIARQVPIDIDLLDTDKI